MSMNRRTTGNTSAFTDILFAAGGEEEEEELGGV